MPGRMTRIRASCDRIPHYPVYFFTRVGFTGLVMEETRLASIADTGTGIPVEVREKIYEPFFTTKEVGKGTGQGLAMARAIVVEKHGGTLTFETEMGKGTTFLLRLPLGGSPVREEALVS
jgi:signal transduction histidine kinase